jgi:hypothetical protein
MPYRMDANATGDAKSAAKHDRHWPPLIPYKDRRGGLVICQGADKGRCICSDAVRRPLSQGDAASRQGLLDIDCRLEPLGPTGTINTYQRKTP